MAERKVGTYQMLWDCPFCGTSKLLGVDHRHCPSCGAAQDPARRYFPSEEDKVAVEDHRFTGADKACANCSTPNAKLASHCINCGSALDEAKEVAKAAARTSSSEASKAIEQQQKEAKTAPPPPPPKKSGWAAKGCLLGCAVIVLLGVVFAVVAAMWKKEEALVVSGHRWERAVSVEEYGPTQDSAWCDSVPAGADVTSRRQEVRSHNKVSDGETCHTEQHDNGDGTFSEIEKCVPKTRDEPVYDDKCTYTVNRWHEVNTVKADGSGGEQPTWPKVRLGREGDCVGCQRQGSRKESYTVSFKAGTESHDCAFAQEKWSSFQDGSRWKGEIGVVSGSLDCDSLKAAR